VETQGTNYFFENDLLKLTLVHFFFISSPEFLLYHRAMLLDFERELLQRSPGLDSLPYWLSTGEAESPGTSMMFREDYFGNSRGCIQGDFHGLQKPTGECVRRELRNGAWYAESVLSVVLQNAGKSFSSFSTHLEHSYHGAVHNGIGGDMGNILQSPWDPLFWMHHSAVDYLWHLWFIEVGKDAPYEGYHSVDHRWVTKNDEILGRKAGTMLNVENLCYKYANHDAKVNVATNGPLGSPNRPATNAATNSSIPQGINIPNNVTNNTTNTTNVLRDQPGNRVHNVTNATPIPVSRNSLNNSVAKGFLNSTLSMLSGNGTGNGTGSGLIPIPAPFSQEFLSSMKMDEAQHLKLFQFQDMVRLVTNFVNKIKSQGVELPNLSSIKEFKLPPELTKELKGIQGAQYNQGSSMHPMRDWYSLVVLFSVVWSMIGFP
jgi:hypothetical protein